MIFLIHAFGKTKKLTVDEHTLFAIRKGGCKFVGATSAFLFTGAVSLMLSLSNMLGWHDLPGAAGFGFFGVILCLAGSLGLWVYRAKRNLVTEAELANQLGVDEAEIRRIIEQNGVEPQLLINDDRHFAREDFGEALLLLRASSQPEQETALLLRPVSAGILEPEKLLRVPEANASSEAPVYSTNGSHS